MTEAILYLLSVLVALLVSLLIPGSVVPDFALGFALPLILFGRIKEALIVMILIVLTYGTFSATSITNVIAVHAVWTGGLIFAQRFLNQAWVVQGVLAALFLGVLQFGFLAQGSPDAVLSVMVHTGVNMIWFVIILAFADNQQWNETLFE